MRSEAELREASGYAGRPRDFDDLIRILDRELRLITPTDPEGSAGRGAGRPSGRRAVLSAHPRLPGPLAARLADPQAAGDPPGPGRAAAGGARGDLGGQAREPAPALGPRSGPSIRLLTAPKDWTEPQRRMMRRAGRVHGLRAPRPGDPDRAWRPGAAIEGYGSLQASALVESLKTAGTADVPAIIEQLAAYRRWADPRLGGMLRDADARRAAIISTPASPCCRSIPAGRLPRTTACSSPRRRAADPRGGLEPHRARLVPRLWAELEPAGPGDARLLAVGRCPGPLSTPGTRAGPSVGGKVARALVTVNPWSSAHLARRPAPGARPARRPRSRRSSATRAARDRASPGHEHPGRLRRATTPHVLAGCSWTPTRRPIGASSRPSSSRRSRTVPVFQAELASGDPSPGGDEAGKPNEAKDATRRAAGAGGRGPVRLGQAERGLAPAAAQPRSPAAQLHRQLARAPGGRSAGHRHGRARSTASARGPRDRADARDHDRRRWTPSSSIPRPRPGGR